LLDTCLSGYKEFQRTGETPNAAYHALRQLYVQTDGWFNDAFQFIYGLQHPAVLRYPIQDSILDINENACQEAVNGLKRNGYFIFKQKVAEKYLEPLTEFSLRTPAKMLRPGEIIEATDVCFDPKNPIASIYRMPEQTVLNQQIAQQIIADPALLHIAQNYLGSQISVSNVQLWWTTPFACKEPKSELAQLFHFDISRVKWLKFFVYLTDVGTNDGPHCYVRGSQSRKPKACLEDRRFQDDELHKLYKPEDFAEITGPRGTLMAVDTRGWHKAKLPTAGNRLIMQIEYASTLFGETYGHPTVEIKTAELQKAYDRDKQLLANYEIVRQGTAALAGAAR
jgi:hypothetical protein